MTTTQMPIHDRIAHDLVQRHNFIEADFTDHGVFAAENFGTRVYEAASDASEALIVTERYEIYRVREYSRDYDLVVGRIADRLASVAGLSLDHLAVASLIVAIHQVVSDHIRVDDDYYQA